MAFSINLPYLKEFLIGLLNTPSPTGLAEPAIAYVERELQRYADRCPLVIRRTARGSLLAEWQGQATTMRRALTAHVDTLGAMVREIKPNGCLRLTRLGGLVWPAVETEGCTVFTAHGRAVRGSLMIVHPSAHVYEDVATLKRSEENLEMRLDECVFTAADVQGLGIQVGDFVAFDPRVEAGHAGYIRSRFLDDKAGVACILAALDAMFTAGQTQPAQTTYLHFSNYEEVGLGGTDLPHDLEELVVVDMAAVGSGQTSSEHDLTICVKDSGGPYHIDLLRKLRHLADAAHIPYELDIYPHYTSDGTAYWHSGGLARIALVGPGVGASHNYERTHTDALQHTTQLLVEYLRNP